MDEPLWDIETAFYVKSCAIDPDKARTFTMFRWLWLGDLRPLEAAIVEGREIPQAVLNLLADMIADDLVGKSPPYRLKAVSRRRGRPKEPGTAIRNRIAALAYETEDGEKSDEAFKRIAAALGTSHQTIRQAVTSFRNRRSAE
jgi:hypothetical protein